MIIRRYENKDCLELTQLFYDTVHSVNAADYTKEQLEAWTGRSADPGHFSRAFAEHFTLVAEEEGVLTGFGDLGHCGCFPGYGDACFLDHLYVHCKYQRQGIASAILKRLEEYGGKKAIVTHASITAKPYFQRKGYLLIKAQQVERNGIILKNYVMVKPGDNRYANLDI